MKTISKVKPGIIIMGGHVQALGILRILSKHQVSGIILDDTQWNISRFSNHCQSFVQCSSENWADQFKSWQTSQHYEHWVVFPTHDSHVEFLSKNKAWLEPYFKVSSDSWERVSVFYDKKFSYELSQRLGIPMAKTFCLIQKSDLLNLKIDFPCIIKPSVMHHFYSALKQKVLLCENREMLIKNFERALTVIPQDEIIIQSIIPGDSSAQYSVGLLAVNGKVYAQMSACRMRQHPIDFGNATTYAETEEITEIQQYAQRIMQDTGFTGMCEIEFKKDAIDHQYKFLEVNPRTWKWHAIAEKANVDMLWMFYQYLQGLNIEPNLYFAKASFYHSLTDIPIRFKLWRLGKSYAFRKVKPTQHAVWDWQDPLPWIMEKILLPYLIFKR
ncbi:MAG: hypothetical protein FJX95_04400 [Bacteroidetes bacterium]|nr:hypothetical protein [Bacteroidota bacterium]